MRTIVEFVHHGLALTIAPPAVITPADRVRAVPIRHHAPTFGVSLARSTSRELGAAARVLSVLAQEIAASS